MDEGQMGEAAVGTVKAVIGYGIGLAVVGIVVTYAIRAYLKIRRDNVMKLAKKDSERLKLSDSASYEHSFLGAPIHPPATKAAAGAGTEPATLYDYRANHVEAHTPHLAATD
jgi:hypothetical protein